MNPTKQQQAIIDEIGDGTGHIMIQARAGSGKTTSILMAVDAIAKAHPEQEVVVCAYNKAIAEEIKGKLIDRGHTNIRKVSASTLHSLGFGLVRAQFKPRSNSTR